MANIPRGAPKGKKSFEVFEDVTVDDLVVTTANITKINDADADSLKIMGELTTRAAADNSMYVPVAASSGHERLWKVAGKVTSNDGGYFDALYANASTTTTATGGEIRAIEGKATVLANMDAGAIATGVYAKVNVSGASAEVATAIGLDVLLEEESSGTITSGIGVRVQGGDGAIDYALDSSGDYRKAAIKMPELSGGAITAATIAGAGAPAQSSAAGDTGFVGLYKDTADGNAISAIFKYAGLYYHVKLTDTTDS